MSDYLEQSDVFFTLSTNGTIQSFSGGFLKNKFVKALSKIENVKALQVAYINQTEYLLVCRAIPSML